MTNENGRLVFDFICLTLALKDETCNYADTRHTMLDLSLVCQWCTFGRALMSKKHEENVFFGVLPW